MPDCQPPPWREKPNSVLFHSFYFPAVPRVTLSRIWGPSSPEWRFRGALIPDIKQEQNWNWGGGLMPQCPVSPPPLIERWPKTWPSPQAAQSGGGVPRWPVLEYTGGGHPPVAAPKSAPSVAPCRNLEEKRLLWRLLDVPSTQGQGGERGGGGRPFLSRGQGGGGAAPPSPSSLPALRLRPPPGQLGALGRPQQAHPGGRPVHQRGQHSLGGRRGAGGQRLPDVAGEEEICHR